MSLSLITRKFTVEEYEKMATEGIIKHSIVIMLAIESKEFLNLLDENIETLVEYEEYVNSKINTLRDEIDGLEDII